MIFLAKACLGLCGTLALAGAYVFHEGVIRVDVDETGGQSSHVHFWLPATVVPAALHVVPRHKLEQAAVQIQPYMPAIRELTKQLRKYPDVDLVDVRDKQEHVHVAVHGGRLFVDVVSDTDNVHVSFPVETISDVAEGLQSAQSGV